MNFGVEMIMKITGVSCGAGAVRPGDDAARHGALDVSPTKIHKHIIIFSIWELFFLLIVLNS